MICEGDVRTQDLAPENLIAVRRISTMRSGLGVEFWDIEEDGDAGDATGIIDKGVARSEMGFRSGSRARSTGRS